ncbi:MAG: hypothetical protein ABIK28_11945 [Planctomycetota bacterium]
MKEKNVFLILFAFAFFAISCASSLHISGGGGDSVDSVAYEKFPEQRMDLGTAFQNASIEIKVGKCTPGSPVEPALDYIEKAFELELEANGAVVKSGIYDATLELTFSRYATREHGNYFEGKTCRTYVDLEYRIFNNVDGQVIVEDKFSTAGKGSNPAQANKDALTRALKKVLTDDALNRYLASLSQSKGDIVAHMLDKLSLSLLKDFESSVTGSDPVRVAFVGFKQDEANRFSGTFLSSLKKFWCVPKYRFFTRDQMDRLLQEASIQVSDMFDESTIVELGKLEAADYLISGNTSRRDGKTLLEAQVIKMKTGEVISSKTTLVKTE